MSLIRTMQANGYHIVVLSPTDEATVEFGGAGVEHVPIRFSQYGRNPLREIEVYRALVNELDRLRPVASLHFTLKPNTIGTLAAQKAGVPVINNLAGRGRAFSSEKSLVARLVTQFYRRAFRHSSKIFFQNEEDMAFFIDRGMAAAPKSERLPGSGVDLEAWPEMPMPAGPPRFLFVGRLLTEKGIGEFIEAACWLKLIRPDALFFVAGEHDGSPPFIAREKLDRAVSDGVINYLGMVAPDQMKELLASATCVVLPSYCGEGVPRSLLEACATGRPIIATENRGCRDVVRNRENGFMVPARDPAALADAFLEIAQLPEDAHRRFGKVARCTVEEDFDEKIVLQGYLDTIGRVRAGSH